jgi:hypothetical protein
VTGLVLGKWRLTEAANHITHKQVTLGTFIFGSHSMEINDDV